MFAKLESLERKYEELVSQLSDPAVLSDQDRYRKLAKTHSDLGDLMAAFREYKQVVRDLEDNQEMTQDADPEIRELAQAEAKSLKESQADLEAKLRLQLLPKDPMDEKNILLEIRAGTGGDEAALFAGDLFRMYTRYAETKRWKVEIMSQSETGTGGFKEVIASISGDKVYSRLKYESGAHRVQRVPVTESQGRIHTSAAGVLVSPDVEADEVEINDDDLRIDVYRSSGPGGQGVNTTDSAVRITDLKSVLLV